MNTVTLPSPSPRLPSPLWPGTLSGGARMAAALWDIARDYVRSVPRAHPVARRRARAQWCQRAAQRLIITVGLRVSTVHGEAPSGGVIVCNHLSYLDILALAAQMPCVFVAKREVRSWPLFGWLARGAGTLFIDRSRKRDILRTTTEIQDALDDRLAVIVFPEGTSSDGAEVLPFKPALFEGLREVACAVCPAAIDYRRPGGSVEDEVCFWRDMNLAPHLFNLLAHPGVEVRVAFGEPWVALESADRRDLAARLRQEVIALRSFTQS